MKKFIPALAIAALALTGCASGSTDAETSDGGRLHEVRITLTDGREVTCIKYASYNQGGLSCDWGGAK